MLFNIMKKYLKKSFIQSSNNLLSIRKMFKVSFDLHFTIILFWVEDKQLTLSEDFFLRSLFILVLFMIVSTSTFNNKDWKKCQWKFEVK